jgi:hypothetical protein
MLGFAIICGPDALTEDEKYWSTDKGEYVIPAVNKLIVVEPVIGQLLPVRLAVTGACASLTNELPLSTDT